MAVGEAAIDEAVRRLRGAGCVWAEDEASLLAAVAADDQELAATVARRVGGEPLEQVIGFADFGGVRVRLRPGVFAPRVRSGLLVDVAADAARTAGGHHLPAHPGHRLGGGSRGDGARGDGADGGAVVTVVDLGCGSGALGLAVAHRVPGIELYGADVDPVAVACARDNYGPDGAERVFLGDLFTALPERLRGRIDVVVANVPYVATAHLPLLPAEARDHEPRSALDGGADGLEVYRALVSGAAHWLAPGGVVVSEITEAQVDGARAAARAAGLTPRIVHDDDLDATVIAAHC